MSIVPFMKVPLTHVQGFQSIHIFVPQSNLCEKNSRIERLKKSPVLRFLLLEVIAPNQLIPLIHWMPLNLLMIENVMIDYLQKNRLRYRWVKMELNP